MNKSLSRRNFLKLGAGVAATAALAACAPQAPAPQSAPAGGTPAPSSQSFGKDTVVLRWHGRLGTQGDNFDRQIKIFNEQQFPKIFAKSENFPGADYFTKINTLIAGGTIGDGWWLSAIEGGYRMVATGAYRPIDEFVASLNYDLGQHEDKCEMARYQGKLYSLPWDTQPGRTGLYFNKKMFDDAKVAYPTDNWTYDDMITASKALTDEKNQSYGMCLLTDYFGGLIQARAYGGDFIDKPGEKCLVKDPPTVAALEMMGNMVLKDKSAILGDKIPGGSWTGRAQLFAANKLAMYQDGFWGKYIKDYVEPERWGVVRMPLGPAKVHGSMYEFDFVGVSSKTPHPQETFLLTTFFCTKAAGTQLAFQDMSVPGGRPDIFADPDNLKDPHFKEFKDAMREIQQIYLPSNFRETEYAKTIVEALAPYYLGEKGLQECLDKAYNDGQAVLQKDSLGGPNSKFEPYVPVWMRGKS